MAAEMYSHRQLCRTLLSLGCLSNRLSRCCRVSLQHPVSPEVCIRIRLGCLRKCLILHKNLNELRLMIEWNRVGFATSSLLSAPP